MSPAWARRLFAVWALGTRRRVVRRSVSIGNLQPVRGSTCHVRTRLAALVAVVCLCHRFVLLNFPITNLRAQVSVAEALFPPFTFLGASHTSTVSAKSMDGHASRKLLVSSFGLFGLVTGLIIYFQPFTESEFSCIIGHGEFRSNGE